MNILSLIRYYWVVRSRILRICLVKCVVGRVWVGYQFVQKPLVLHSGRSRHAMHCRTLKTFLQLISTFSNIPHSNSKDARSSARRIWPELSLSADMQVCTIIYKSLLYFFKPWNLWKEMTYYSVLGRGKGFPPKNLYSVFQRILRHCLLTW